MRKIIAPLAVTVLIGALVACGESEDAASPQKTILLNGQTVGLSSADFSALHALVGGAGGENCYADQLSDFFAAQGVDFDSSKFVLEISDGGTIKINYRAPDCGKMEMMAR
jgi:hypothetical protein